MVSPPPMPKPTTTPWLFPEGGVNSSQVRGKQGKGWGGKWGGGLWPSWGRISTSTLHWSKMRIFHARALVRGGRVGRWTLHFCNLDVSRPDCLLSQPKMDPSGATDYIREDRLFSQGRPDKRGASVPLAIWSQNNRKGPRKKKKKEPSQHTALNERNAVWIDGMAGQISKHTVKPHTFTQRLEPNLHQQIKPCTWALMSRSANHWRI